MQSLVSANENGKNTKTRLQLLIQELEGRPNVTTLNETMKQVCKQLAEVVKDLREHEERTEKRFKEFMAKKEHR
jgi:uncharacterized lipoprotein YmbA